MNKRELFKRLSIFAVILALLCGCWLVYKKHSEPIARTFFAADTVCTITLFGGDEKTLDGAVKLCNTLADKLNCKDESSELGILNKTKVSKSPSQDLVNILNQATYYSQLSDGAFDVTVKPLSDLWDFKKGIEPSAEDIKAALPKIGQNNLLIEGNTITLKNGAEVDLGGIAKGYIANKISDFLVKNGVKSAIVNLGGNVTVIGKNKGKDFTVGIQKPFSNDVAATVTLSDRSVVTSGIYQRYFEKNGVKYHHLLNLKTGYPEQNSVASVTVISKNATNADALSTVLFLLGKNKGLAFVEEKEDLECIYIMDDNKIVLSSGLKMDDNIITLK